MLSQDRRIINAQGDSLRMGTGWTPHDLAKPQVLVDSVFGDSHPGSYHLDRLAKNVTNGLYASGCKPANYTVTDMCDGIAQASIGMSYSLASREMITMMTEIHAMAAPFDGMALISSCDKSVPGHLMALCRLDMPSLHICGGSMLPGPDFDSSEKMYHQNELYHQGQVTPEELLRQQVNCCPSCGACQFMGTASTMQCMSEALGLSMPGGALMPAAMNRIEHLAFDAGMQVAKLMEWGLTPSKIVTRNSLENAIMVHGAVSGSTNATLHIPAIAHELGMNITVDLFDEMHRKIPVLTSMKTSGKWPSQMLWFAGGIPAVMRELVDFLHLDEMTVTGKTVGENLAELERNGYFRTAEGMLNNYGYKYRDVIKSVKEPYKADGGTAVLYGNLAPKGCVIKHAAADPAMHVHTGPAKIYDGDNEASDGIYHGEVVPGDVVIIRYEGPRGNGMPEMFKPAESIYNCPELVKTVALVTDGRYSGATRGPAVGYVSPEAAVGGPIALVEEGDLISINIPKRTIDITGVAGVPKTPEEMDAILAERRKHLKPFVNKSKGVARLFQELASDATCGAYLKYTEDEN